MALMTPLVSVQPAFAYGVIQSGVPNLLEIIEELGEFDLTYNGRIQDMITIIVLVNLLPEFFVSHMERVFGHLQIIAESN
jgi:hypothetical protein